MPKTFASLQEVQRTYFPNQILPRLEERLCSELNLTKPHQHRRKTEDLEIGLIEVAKSNYSSKSDIAESIKLFYRQEGYKVAIKKDFIEVTKKKEKYPEYYIQLIEGDNSYMVWVHKSQLKLLDLN